MRTCEIPSEGKRDQIWGLSDLLSWAIGLVTQGVVSWWVNVDMVEHLRRQFRLPTQREVAEGAIGSHHLLGLHTVPKSTDAQGLRSTPVYITESPSESLVVE